MAEITIIDSTNTPVYGEIIYQGTSLSAAVAKGTVVSINPEGGTIIIKDMYGTFSSANGAIRGTTSAFAGLLIEDDPMGSVQIVDDFGAQNKQVVVIDFTENNPFSDDDEAF